MTTDREKGTLAHLVAAWNSFLLLDDPHPDDQLEFRLAIHAAQALIAFRVAKRADPGAWGSQTPSDAPT